LNLHNFLTSGISFDETEEALEFRFHFLNALLLISIAATLTFVLLDQLGINPLGKIHLFSSELFGLTSTFVAWYLRKGKHAYITCAWIMIVATYLVFSSALIFVVNDELRVVWYYMFVVVTYVALGNKYGLGATLAAILTVSVAKFHFGISLSDHAYFTFTLSLAVTSGIAHTYTNLANSFFDRLAFNLTQLRDLASKDPLTGVKNARSFYELSNKLIQVGQRNATPYCTLFIDLEHFKSINDQYGHAAGDAVLCAISNCISSHCRESDIVGRIGGEEFAVFLPSTNAHGAVQLAEKLRHNTEILIHTFPNNEQRAVTLSIGVAQSESKDQSIEDIQKRADKAMYKAKKQGKKTRPQSSHIRSKLSELITLPILSKNN